MKPSSSEGHFRTEIALRAFRENDHFIHPGREVWLTSRRTEQRVAVKLGSLDQRKALFKPGGIADQYKGRVFDGVEQSSSSAWEYTGLDLKSRRFAHLAPFDDSSDSEFDSGGTVDEPLKILRWGSVPYESTRYLYLVITHGEPGKAHMAVTENGVTIEYVGSGHALGDVVSDRKSFTDLREAAAKAGAKLPQGLLVTCRAGAETLPGVTLAQQTADRAGIAFWAGTTNVAQIPDGTKGFQGAAFGLEADKETGRLGEFKLFRPSSWKKAAHPEYDGHVQRVSLLEELLGGGPGNGSGMRGLDAPTRREMISTHWKGLSEQLEEHLFTHPLQHAETVGDGQLDQSKRAATQPALRRTRELAAWASEEIGELGKLLRNPPAESVDSVPERDTLRQEMASLARRIDAELIPAWDEQLGDSLNDPQTSAELPSFPADEDEESVVSGSDGSTLSAGNGPGHVLRRSAGSGASSDAQEQHPLEQSLQQPGSRTGSPHSILREPGAPLTEEERQRKVSFAPVGEQSASSAPPRDDNSSTPGQEKQVSSVKSAAGTRRDPLDNQSTEHPEHTELTQLPSQGSANEPPSSPEPQPAGEDQQPTVQDHSQLSTTEQVSEQVESGSDEVRERYPVPYTALLTEGTQGAFGEIALRMAHLALSTRERGTALPVAEVKVFGDGSLSKAGSEGGVYTARTLAAEIARRFRGDLSTALETTTPEGGAPLKLESLQVNEVKPSLSELEDGPSSGLRIEISLRLPGENDAFLDESLCLRLEGSSEKRPYPSRSEISSVGGSSPRTPMVRPNFTSVGCSTRMRRPPGSSSSTAVSICRTAASRTYGSRRAKARRCVSGARCRGRRPVPCISP